MDEAAGRAIEAGRAVSEVEWDSNSNWWSLAVFNHTERQAYRQINRHTYLCMSVCTYCNLTVLSLWQAVRLAIVFFRVITVMLCPTGDELIQ